MDYNDLRQQGIEQIQHLTGEIWTDYNIHDPGVTILEQLCYALTDLNYRAGFSIDDLMAEGGPPASTYTVRPRPMLTTGPVTLTDWRMLLLDIDGVKNAWVTKVDTSLGDYTPKLYFSESNKAITLQDDGDATPFSLKGLYQIDYILEEDFEDQAATVESIIFQRFHANRNLCEDLYRIERLTNYPINITAKIEITHHPDPASIVAQVYALIKAYLQPSISFYTLQEMLAKGYPMDEIMDGPKLAHGFLEKEAVVNLSLRQSIRISDLIKLLMSIDGVLAIDQLNLTYQGNTITAIESNTWEFELPDGNVPILVIPPSNTPNNDIELWQSGLQIEADWEQSSEQLQVLLQQENAKKNGKNSYRIRSIASNWTKSTSESLSIYFSSVSQSLWSRQRRSI